MWVSYTSDMTSPATHAIRGATGSDIADSVRELLDRGELAAGDALPPMRTLAERLGVNRNTVMAAYHQLAQAGLVVSRGRSGTVIADRSRAPEEGFAPASVLRDVGTGNPDPALIPDPSAALHRVAGHPVLYGEPVIDPRFRRWAKRWMSDAVPASRPSQLTVTSGAVDAVERLLAQALLRDDAVALENPCFLASIHTVRLGGYRALAVPVDAEGMTPAGLRDARAGGARAVVCTPRAQNPTGASLSATRAAELRAVLADHPYVLVIEDDHFSMLSQQPYHSLIGPDHQRWAIVRSVSKFLGPDMCLAVMASDPETAERLGLRLSPGTTWVSHLLQRLTLALAGDPGVVRQIAHAGRHYAERNEAFAARLRAHGIEASSGDGLNLWVPLPVAARAVAKRLQRRGWRVRKGDEFTLEGETARRHLRLTVHDLDDDEAERLAADLAASISAALSVR